MLNNQEYHGSETVGGLEVCVLGEVKASQEGAFRVAASHAEMVVKAGCMAQHNKSRVVTVITAFQAHRHL